jgi:hypothetical protein
MGAATEMQLFIGMVIEEVNGQLIPAFPDHGKYMGEINKLLIGLGGPYKNMMCIWVVAGSGRPYLVYFLNACCVFASYATS